MPHQHAKHARFDNHTAKHKHVSHQTHTQEQTKATQHHLEREEAKKAVHSYSHHRIAIDPAKFVLAMTVALIGKAIPAAAQEYVYGVQNTVTSHDSPSWYQTPFKDTQARNIVLTRGVNTTNTTGNETGWHIEALDQVAMQWNQEVTSQTQYVSHRHYNSHGAYTYTSYDLENMASQVFVEEFANSMGNHLSNALLPIAPLFFVNQAIKAACTTLLPGFRNIDFTGTLSNVPVEICSALQNAVISQAQASATDAANAEKNARLALLSLILLAWPLLAVGYAASQKLCNDNNRRVPELLCEGLMLPIMCCAAACGRRRGVNVHNHPDHYHYAEAPRGGDLQLPQPVAIEVHEAATTHTGVAVAGMYAQPQHAIDESSRAAETPSAFVSMV